MKDGIALALDEAHEFNSFESKFPERGQASDNVSKDLLLSIKVDVVL